MFGLLSSGAALSGFQVSRSAVGGRTVHSNRASSSVCMMAGKVVVSDGTDSFYESRNVFQALHDFGDFSSITASSSSNANAKKMLLSRQARYSGLCDVLSFSEDELSESLTGAETWVSVNSDGAALGAQLKVVKAAGVKRVFLHFSADGPTDGISAAELQPELDGLTFTIMRTGALKSKGTGGGLKISEIDDPEFADLSSDGLTKEDAFRVLTEAITLDSSHGRMFSLSTSEDMSQLKEMRMAGCGRREETDALLSGKIKDKGPEVPLTVEELAAKAKQEAEEEAALDAVRDEEVAILGAAALAKYQKNKKLRLELEEQVRQDLKNAKPLYNRVDSDADSSSGDDDEADNGGKDDAGADDGGNDDGVVPPPPPNQPVA